MIKQVVGVLLVLIVCVVNITTLQVPTEPETIPSETSIANPVPSPSPQLLTNPNIVQAAEITWGEPRKLSIPTLGLDVPVVSAGANTQGLQDVPSDNGTVSWWKLGFYPGTQGSAVFAGHFKIDDGSPGVFYNLNQVEVGDPIDIVDEFGNPLSFRIVETKVYSVEDFPTKDIYMNKDSKRIVIVTCTGNFLSDKNDYSHRFVVYANLVE